MIKNYSSQYLMIVIQRVNNFALYLYTITIVFESWDPFGLKGVFSIARMAGLFYFVSSIPFIYNRLFAVETKNILISLLFFLFFYTLSALRTVQPGSPSAFSMPLFQNIIIFLLITNHLIQSKKIIKYVLLSFCLGVTLMGILHLLGIGTNFDTTEMRLSLFEENPNMIGNKAVVAFIIILYIILLPSKTYGKKTIINIVLITTIPLFFSLILASGSRGAFLIFLLGILSSLFLIRIPLGYKAIFFVIGIIAIIYIVVSVYSTESIMQKRLMQTIEEKKIGGRDYLLKNAIKKFKEYPLLGVGRIALQKEETRDPHNVFMAVLLASGICGFLPFLFFNYKIFNKVIVNYRLSKDFFYPVLAIILFLILLKSGGLIISKFLWFNYAILFGNKSDS